MRRREFMLGVASLILLRKVRAAPAAEEAVIVDATPVGYITQFVRPSLPLPAGFLLCDGSVVNKVDYPALHAVIGDTYGKSRLPDLRGRTATVLSNDVGQAERFTQFGIKAK